MSIRYSFSWREARWFLPMVDDVPLATGAAGRHIYAMARTQGRGHDDWTTGIFRTVRALAGLTE
jgi:hypothetical protein